MKFLTKEKYYMQLIMNVNNFLSVKNEVNNTMRKFTNNLNRIIFKCIVRYHLLILYAGYIFYCILINIFTFKTGCEESSYMHLNAIK